MLLAFCWLTLMRVLAPMGVRRPSNLAWAMGVVEVVVVRFLPQSRYWQRLGMHLRTTVM